MVQPLFQNIKIYSLYLLVRSPSPQTPRPQAASSLLLLFIKKKNSYLFNGSKPSIAQCSSSNASKSSNIYCLLHKKKPCKCLRKSWVEFYAPKDRRLFDSNVIKTIRFSPKIEAARYCFHPVAGSVPWRLPVAHGQSF